LASEEEKLIIIMIAPLTPRWWKQSLIVFINLILYSAAHVQYYLILTLVHANFDC
jgi:hypothetical protein